MAAAHTVDLVDIKGETDIHISVEITEKGDLLFSGQDLGEAPRRIFGDSDYEYWLRISKDEKDKVIVALIKEHYSGEIPDIYSLLSGQLRRPLRSIRIKESIDWSKVPIRQKDEILLALIKKHYSGNQSVISEFQNLLKSKGVSSKFSSYA